MNWDRLVDRLPPALTAAATGALADVRPYWERVEETALYNQAKVLRAFHGAGISEYHFAPSTGYGLGDTGRDRLEAVFAAAFGAEAGLVRTQIVSGTHAITLALFGVLRPGDELVAAVGAPYDTLQAVIRGGTGSLYDWGVSYREVAVQATGAPDLQALKAAVGPRTRAVLIQRSRGYSLRPSLSVAQVGEVIAAVRSVRPDVYCLVDNCYGEFTEEQEPAEVGADLVMGSLIKNPGGGLAPTGGYVVGRRELVEAAAARLTAPGIGSEVGASPDGHRLLLQGFFLAPHTVAEAICGAHFTAALFERLGFRVRPRYQVPRTDLIQAVELDAPERLVAFCQAIQRCGPVDAHVRPDPEHMAGYADQVIMAAGTFVQGSSIELSADGPLRPPYAVYFQGGLTRQHVIWAAVKAAAELAGQGLLPG